MSAIQACAGAARTAARQLALLPDSVRSEALRRIAKAVRETADTLLAANREDVRLSEEKGRPSAFLDRLRLTPERIEQMAAGMEKVASLPDPLGETIAEWTRPNGLRIRQVRVPIGVIGFIYESRATVTCDAAALCLKSGNAVILRGGSESLGSNLVLADIFERELPAAGLPGASVQLLRSGSRDEVLELCACGGLVDVIIPRGGKGLVSTVVEHAKMPVLKHMDGICHTYIDETADLAQAIDIADDAKTQRPGVCNAMETLLVHRNITADFLPRMAARLAARGVEIRACAESLPLMPGSLPATEEDWRTEYEDLILSVKTVGSLQEAIDHINRYGSHHSDAIITENAEHADAFQRGVDSACVYHNCSTRFSDGEEYGFGAEIGIGTDKLHARGPMGLRELTSYQYRITGSGQVKDPARLA